MIKIKKKKNPMIFGVKKYLQKCISENREVIVVDKFLSVRGNLRSLGDNEYGILKDIPNGMSDAEFKINDIEWIDFDSNIISLSEKPINKIID